VKEVSPKKPQVWYMYRL